MAGFDALGKIINIKYFAFGHHHSPNGLDLCQPIQFTNK